MAIGTTIHISRELLRRNNAPAIFLNTHKYVLPDWVSLPIFPQILNMFKLTALFLFVLVSVSASSQQTIEINVCIIDQKQLKTVRVDYDRNTGDTTLMVNGSRKAFRQVYSSIGKEYAASTPWYINNETLVLRGKKFTKYGLPRVLGTTEVVRAGEYKGVGVYVEAGLDGVPEVIYVPVRSGCEFQPYQMDVSK